MGFEHHLQQGRQRFDFAHGFEAAGDVLDMIEHVMEQQVFCQQGFSNLHAVMLRYRNRSISMNHATAAMFYPNRSNSVKPRMNTDVDGFSFLPTLMVTSAC